MIGRGLLGSAVLRADDTGSLAIPIRWDDVDRALTDLGEGLERLRSVEGERIEIYWCAGRGVTASPAEALNAEFTVFEGFLRLLLALPEDVRGRLTVFLASSVGGAYAGSKDAPFTERTPPSPASAYGVFKLRMETALSRFTDEGGWRSFIARITNLYGPGQDLAKGQGLLSVIVASYVTRRPISVYVPLDTLRNYIYEDDCARVVLAGTRRVFDEAPGTTVVKIVGAMVAQSIGAILGENKRLRGRTAPIILGQGDATGQASDLRVRSEVWTDLDALVRTTIPEGLDNLYRAQLSSIALGRTP